MAAFGLPSRLAGLVPRFAPESTAKVEDAFTKALDWAIDNAWDDAVARAAATAGPSATARVDAVSKSFGKELATVGAATGGLAAVPAVGTVSSLAASAAELGWFTKRAAELILTVGAVHGHGLGPNEPSLEERRAWVLAVLLFGKKASKEFERVAAEAAASAGGTSALSLPTSVLARVNGSLARKAATRYGARRAAVAAGQAVPFGIGAVVGGTANYWATRRLARQADKFFRQLPRSVAPAAAPVPLPGPSTSSTN